MKKYILLSGVIFTALSTINAQQQATLSRFIIGTNPVTYYIESETNVNQYLNSNLGTVQNDSTRATTHSLNMHISLFVGYFVTKNICAGLEFGSNSTGTYGTFIRYYFGQKNPDSAKVNFFMQANGTLSYSNTDNPAITNYYMSSGGTYNMATSDYNSSQTILSFGIGIAAAFHLTRHWGLETEVAYIRASTVQNNGSFTTTTTYFYTAYPNTTDIITTPALKNTSIDNRGAFKIMLSYRI